MIHHTVRVVPSRIPLPKEEHLAWKLAEVATEPVPVDADVADMAANRLIDDAAVALAAINRDPVSNARSQALAHPRPGGGTLFGLPDVVRVEAEWAAWANGVAVRELDMHDTFLAADYSHPGDTIPPLLAVAQQLSKGGAELVRAIVTAYEIQIDLVKGICLHEHRKDHIAHLAPAVAGGIGTMLGLPVETVYQAIQHAVHLSFSTRQSRKGAISSWKAYAPAFAGKLAIEAVDRAMRGEGSPSPIYEGEDGVIAYMLGGSDATYDVPLPERGEARRAIMESYTKAHSAEYQAQALIDLAFRLRERLPDLDSIESVLIRTSHHTHQVIGTGSGDPQKYDPEASRETLDHSVMYVFAVALQDGRWHHVDSYAPSRASREDTVRLWRKVRTVEDPDWTRRYHDPDPSKKAFGARVEVKLKDGSVVADELAVADAHSNGARPFTREDYVGKYRDLTEGIADGGESDRFLELAQRLHRLAPHEVSMLTVALPPGRLSRATRDTRGIF